MVVCTFAFSISSSFFNPLDFPCEPVILSKGLYDLFVIFKCGGAGNLV